MDRAADPAGWAFPVADRDALHRIMTARRDVRRYRPTEVPEEVLHRVLAAAHSAPSVGHSQPWRFIVVTDASVRDQAAWLADAARIEQAAAMDETSGRHLLDLQLEGIREAPAGIVVCCDRRVEAVGVLGRATFPDADMWSCACAIQNLWLAARAEGLGVGWVTLFEPQDLARLVGLPDGVATLGWLCVGYPDERPPAPGLERVGWSSRAAVEDVVLFDRWPTEAPRPPTSHIRGPGSTQVVASRDHTDQLLTGPGSLGVLDQALDRVVARCGLHPSSATLVLIAGDHPVADLGVSPYRRSVTADVLAAARAGSSIGAAAAEAAGISIAVIDAGSSTGDLEHTDAMTVEQVVALIEEGRRIGIERADHGPVALGEIGIGNTTVAAALVAAATGLAGGDLDQLVGLGSGADSTMLTRKRAVVAAALSRFRLQRGDAEAPASECVVRTLAALGGPEAAMLTGVVLGVAGQSGIVVLDGMLTSVAALLACQLEPGVAAHLIAGQRSRERGHVVVLQRLGLQPLLDLRLRAGEGVGAVLATRLLLDGLAMRRTTARVHVSPAIKSTP